MLLTTAIISAIVRPSAVTPPAPVASLTLAPPALALTVGQADVALPVVTAWDGPNGSGNHLTGRTVTWQAGNPAAAALVNGLVHAVAPGQCVLTATCEGITATVQVGVVAATTGAFPSAGVAGTLFRSDGASTARLIRNAFPLADHGASFDPTRLTFVDTNGVQRLRGTVPLAMPTYASGCPKGVGVWGAFASGETSVTGTWRYASASRTGDAADPGRQNNAAVQDAVSFNPPADPDGSVYTADVYPDAAMLATDPTYLCVALGWYAGPLVPAPLVPANATDQLSVALHYQEMWEDTYRVPGGPNGSGDPVHFDPRASGVNAGLVMDGIAEYETELDFYRRWCMTGDPVWWNRATHRAGTKGRYLAHLIGVQSWFNTTDGYVPWYLTTGDDYALVAARVSAYNSGAVCINFLGRNGSGGLRDDPAVTEWHGNTLWSDYRDVSRMLGGWQNAMLLGVIAADPASARMPTTDNGGNNLASTYGPGATQAAYQLWIDAILTRALGPNGELWIDQYKSSDAGQNNRQGQKNYMVNMLLTRLQRHHDLIDPSDARVFPFLQKATDYLLKTQWVPYLPNAAGALTGGGFNYVSVNYNGGSASGGVGLGSGQEAYISLNTFTAASAAYVGRKTQDAWYRGWVDRAFYAFVPGGHLNHGSQGPSECYWEFWATMGNRAQIPVYAPTTTPLTTLSAPAAWQAPAGGTLATVSSNGTVTITPPATTAGTLGADAVATVDATAPLRFRHAFTAMRGPTGRETQLVLSNLNSTYDSLTLHLSADLTVIYLSGIKGSVTTSPVDVLAGYNGYLQSQAQGLLGAAGCDLMVDLYRDLLQISVALADGTIMPVVTHPFVVQHADLSAVRYGVRVYTYDATIAAATTPCTVGPVTVSRLVNA